MESGMQLRSTLWLLLSSFVLLHGCQRSHADGDEPGTIVSDDTITVRYGQLVTGKPKVSEAIEREVYEALNHRRKMLAALSDQPNNGRGARQMQDELDLLTRGFMVRYDLTRAEVNQILARGDASDSDRHADLGQMP